MKVTSWNARAALQGHSACWKLYRCIIIYIYTVCVPDGRIQLETRQTFTPRAEKMNLIVNKTAEEEKSAVSRTQKRTARLIYLQTEGYSRQNRKAVTLQNKRHFNQRLTICPPHPTLEETYLDPNKINHHQSSTTLFLLTLFHQTEEIKSVTSGVLWLFVCVAAPPLHFTPS